MNEPLRIVGTRCTPPPQPPRPISTAERKRTWEEYDQDEAQDEAPEDPFQGEVKKRADDFNARSKADRTRFEEQQQKNRVRFERTLLQEAKPAEIAEKRRLDFTKSQTETKKAFQAHQESNLKEFRNLQAELFTRNFGEQEAVQEPSSIATPEQQQTPPFVTRGQMQAASFASPAPDRTYRRFDGTVVNRGEAQRARNDRFPFPPRDPSRPGLFASALPVAQQPVAEPLVADRPVAELQQRGYLQAGLDFVRQYGGTLLAHGGMGLRTITRSGFHHTANVASFVYRATVGCLLLRRNNFVGTDHDGQDVPVAAAQRMPAPKRRRVGDADRNGESSTASGPVGDAMDVDNNGESPTANIPGDDAMDVDDNGESPTANIPGHGVVNVDDKGEGSNAQPWKPKFDLWAPALDTPYYSHPEMAELGPRPSPKSYIRPREFFADDDEPTLMSRDQYHSRFRVSPGKLAELNHQRDERARIEREKREAAQREKQRAEAARLAAERRAEEERARERAEQLAAEAREQERIAAVQWEEQLESLGLRKPAQMMIQPLTGEWDSQVDDALANGALRVESPRPEPVTIENRDLRMLAQDGTWLNDNCISAALTHLANSINQAAGVTLRQDTPKCMVMNTFFYNNLRRSGGNQFHRLIRRLWGVDEKQFMNVDTVLIPINRNGNHWTVFVIRPTRRQYGFVDSFRSPGAEETGVITGWLESYLDRGPLANDGWTNVMYRVPRQTNGTDCGVFTITNSIFLAMGLDPSGYTQEDMPLQRRRLAGVILNKGFTEDFSLLGL